MLLRISRSLSLSLLPSARPLSSLFPHSCASVHLTDEAAATSSRSSPSSPRDPCVDSGSALARPLGRDSEAASTQSISHSLSLSPPVFYSHLSCAPSVANPLEPPRLSLQSNHLTLSVSLSLHSSFSSLTALPTLLLLPNTHCFTLSFSLSRVLSLLGIFLRDEYQLTTATAVFPLLCRSLHQLCPASES